MLALVATAKAPRTKVNIQIDGMIDNRPMKRCPKCHVVKDLDDFGLRFLKLPNGGQECRVQSRCRDCR